MVEASVGSSPSAFGLWMTGGNPLLLLGWDMVLVVAGAPFSTGQATDDQRQMGAAGALLSTTYSTLERLLKYAGGMFVACCDRRRLGLILMADWGTESLRRSGRTSWRIDEASYQERYRFILPLKFEDIFYVRHPILRHSRHLRYGGAQPWQHTTSNAELKSD